MKFCPENLQHLTICSSRAYTPVASLRMLFSMRILPLVLKF